MGNYEEVNKVKIINEYLVHKYHEEYGTKSQKQCNVGITLICYENNLKK